MVMADPDYEGRVAPPVPEGNDRQRRSRDGIGPFERLDGAAQEGEAIGKLLRLPRERVLTDKRATEGALKALHSPRVLHIATHGFFLPEEKEELPVRDGLSEERKVPVVRTENPLLRSGLALAGANQLRSGETTAY